MFDFVGILASFSLDMSGLLSTAEDMFNALAPIILTIAGIGLGISILAVVGKAIKNAV